INHLLSTIELIANACKELHPSELVVASMTSRRYTNEPESVQQTWSSLFRYERYAADLARSVCQILDIRCLSVPMSAPAIRTRHEAARRAVGSALAPLVLRQLKNFASSVRSEGGDLIL